MRSQHKPYSIKQQIRDAQSIAQLDQLAVGVKRAYKEHMSPKTLRQCDRELAKRFDQLVGR